MKKIAIITYNPPTEAGGVERFCAYLANAFSDRYEIDIFSKKDLSEKIVNLEEGIFKGKFRELSSSVLLGMFFNKKLAHYDLLITNGYNGAFIRHPKKVNVYHGNMAGHRRALQKFSSLLGNLWKIIVEILEKNSGKRSSIVCVSEQCKREIEEFYGLKADIVINNCVNVGYFKPSTMEEKLALRKGLSLPLDRPVIIFTGRLEIGKGVDILMEVIQNRKDWFFYIVCGKGNNFYESVLVNNGNVKIEKGICYNNIAERYKASDVFFLPSRYEGFELSTIEALACGLPIVGYEVGVMRELKYKYGMGNGTILSQEVHIKDVVNALETALKYSKNQEYKNRLREIAVNNFSLASFNANWNKYIEKVISK